MSRSNILIVEDEAIIALEIKLCLQQAGHGVSGLAVSAREALEILDAEEVDLVLIDISINGGIDGIELAQIVCDRYAIPVIYLTGNSDEDTKRRALATRPSGYIVKPFSWQEIQSSIESALLRAGDHVSSEG